jgi:pimeloyl-ACP methyl ester carboxylesterase
MAHDAATASHSSPAERRSYDQAIRRLCQELDRRGPDLAIQQLRQSDVKVILPKIPLPLQSIEIPKNSRPSSETIGIPIVLGYDTKNFPLYPPEGLFVDASALVRTIDGKTSLEFSTDRESIRIDGADYKLAIDPTGAGLHLERQARKLAKSGFISMLRPSSMERRPQIYLLDPYDPAKIPLLMVHGLQSTPVAFASMVNALRSDPDVRAKYQIWQFYYPSGSPVLANAADLRDSLSKTLHTLDPKGEFPSNRRIVVIGHSMGGVISHSLVSSSDGALWASIFRVPPAQLQGDQEAIRRLTRILDFKRDPRVSRVIFMAAPHRGSPMADSFIGWFGNSLARLSPMEESGFSALARKNPEAMMPAAARFYDAGRFSAVRTLSPKSTALLALADLPISIPYHSVIGQQRWEPTAQGSDGVVPYASSHLDGADSELIVRSGHGVIGNADAIREVIRILHEEGAKP